MALIIEQNLCVLKAAVLKVSYALCFHSNSLSAFSPISFLRSTPSITKNHIFFLLNKCIYALTSMLGFHAYTNATLVLHSKIPNVDH